jgi:hypothetical protein
VTDLRNVGSVVFQKICLMPKTGDARQIADSGQRIALYARAKHVSGNGLGEFHDQEFRRERAELREGRGQYADVKCDASTNYSQATSRGRKTSLVDAFLSTNCRKRAGTGSRCRSISIRAYRDSRMPGILEGGAFSAGRADVAVEGLWRSTSPHLLRLTVARYDRLRIRPCEEWP